jgi:hypothetical protein
VTGEHIPTGDLEPVKGTPFDFVKAKKIGARIAEVLHWPRHATRRFPILPLREPVKSSDAVSCRVTPAAAVLTLDWRVRRWTAAMTTTLRSSQRPAQPTRSTSICHARVGVMSTLARCSGP